MKIALKFHGFYVSAEQGGGIDARTVSYPPALVANRPELGGWETFEVEKVDETHIALKTCNGNYVTAENGGGSYLRTNETGRGVWETFGYLSVGDGSVVSLITWDGLHVLGSNVRDGVVDARHVWQGFDVEIVSGGSSVVADTRWFRGSFCIPGGLPGSPYGDGKRIWTPAYGCYDDTWRKKMRDAYKARGYTHFVYNLAGLPYGGDYPELADDPGRVRRDLQELEADGFVPVCCLTDDRNPKHILNSASSCSDLICSYFPVWEMNGPLGDSNKAVEEQNCKDVILAARSAVPDADCWLHFTPGHGSISYASEQGGWEWCQEHGTVGLLGQGGNSISSSDPIYEGKGFETTACRLAGMGGYVVPDWDGGAVPPSWNGMSQLAVKFEWGIYESYHSHATEADLNHFTDQFMTVAVHVNGFCDGGTP